MVRLARFGSTLGSVLKSFSFITACANFKLLCIMLFSHCFWSPIRSVWNKIDNSRIKNAKEKDFILFSFRFSFFFFLYGQCTKGDQLELFFCLN